MCVYFKACLFPNSPPLSHLKFDLQILHIFISLNGYFCVENVCLETSSTQQSGIHDWLAGQSCLCSQLVTPLQRSTRAYVTSFEAKTNGIVFLDISNSNTIHNCLILRECLTKIRSVLNEIKM